ncbi:MAG: hypothetical protein WCI09_12610, partial [Planctomycetota bacterium]
MFKSKNFKEFFWNRSAKRCTRRSNRSGLFSGERLEQRLALTIDIFTNAASGVGAAALPGAVTIVASSPDYDIYLQQVATSPQDLIVANNSSFLGYQSVANINQYRSIYITNGTIGTTTDQPSDFYPMSVGTTTT